MRIITAAELERCGDPAIVFTFGRSGTHLMMDLVRTQFAEFASWKYPGERMQSLYVELDGIATRSEPVARSLQRLRRPPRPVLKTHDLPITRRTLRAAQPALMEWLDARGRMIHLVRDPREAIASWWALEHAGHTRGFVDALWTPEAFIEQRAQAWVAHIASAGAERAALRLRLEEVVHDPAGAVRAIARWFGLTPLWRTPLLPRARSSLAFARMDCLLGVRPNSTEILIRKRVRERYRFDWTSERLALLDAIAGDAMVDTGYLHRPAPRRNRVPHAQPIEAIPLAQAA